MFSKLKKIMSSRFLKLLTFKLNANHSEITMETVALPSRSNDSLQCILTTDLLYPV